MNPKKETEQTTPHGLGRSSRFTRLDISVERTFSRDVHGHHAERRHDETDTLQRNVVFERAGSVAKWQLDDTEKPDRCGYNDILRGQSEY